MTTVEAPPDTAVLARQFEIMSTITQADLRTRAEARKGSLRAAVYPVHGLEAVCAAIGCSVDPTDYMVSTYRNLGDAIAKGVPLRKVIAEFYGRVDGTSKGKGGAMHLADPSSGFMATSGIVGGGLPIAVGLGLAAQLAGEEQVVVVTFGDGATSIGAFHESLNMASLWKLPVVFVCQNNQWGEHTALTAYASQPKLAVKAVGYDMVGEQVDGFDPVALLRAVGSAVARAREGHGPTLLECLTYRLGPHAAVSDMSYVPKGELASALERDPTPSMRTWLASSGLLSEQQLQDLEARALATVDEAFDFAQASDHASPDDLFNDVYAEDWMVPGR